MQNISVVGDPLTLQEAYTYLRLLVHPDEETIENRRPSPTQRSFNFLPLVTILLSLSSASRYLSAIVGGECKINKVNSSLGFPRVMYCYVMIQRISYKDFTMDIMDIELLEETRADNLRKSARQLLAVL